MIEIHTLSVDSQDPRPIAEWWSAALGWPIGENSDEEEVILLAPADRPHQPDMLFLKVPEGKTVKNRLHLDLWPVGGTTREQEVERLLGLGAKPYEDHRNADGTGWVTLLDPDGNEFCVVRSQKERDAQAGQAG